MKIKTLLTFCICLFCTVAVLAQTPIQPPQVTVYGTAELKVAPDEAVFQLEIETVDKDLQRAKLLNDEKTKKLLEVAKQIITDQRLIQTGYVSVSPNYDFTKDDKRVFLGYELMLRSDGHQ